MELLGLTATPERMDAQDVTEFFGGRIAVELRLWEAIDEGFLVPFQYFGVADGTDLSQLRWRRGGYAQEDLDRVVTGRRRARRQAARGNPARCDRSDRDARRSDSACRSSTPSSWRAPSRMPGSPSRALSGRTPEADRDAALRALASGELRVVFSVDVLGEGVDVPSVDTVLLLRPTDSATVFTQQLGRGLRRADGKSYLTVIDLIGQQHRQFRFDRRLGAIVDRRRGPLRRQTRSRIPVPSLWVPRRSRSPEQRDRAPQPSGRRAAVPVEDARR